MDFFKSSRKAAFLFFCLCFLILPLGAQEAQRDLSALTASALEKRLDSSPVWHALLHQTGEKQAIRDTRFLLSAAQYSSRNELIATLTQQFGALGSAEMRCRFPARYVWLSQQLGLAAEPFTSCDPLNEYLEKVPVDTISLVFASQNLKQASSMMGHVFFKLSGMNLEGQMREHAITFYTDADTINLPKLLIQNLSSGMPGWYSVLPYDEVLSHYTMVEDRNVWDFEIRMNATTSKLLQLHLYELRDVQFKYYFHTYNCATLVDELLTVVASQQATTPPADSLWITPIDVIKRAHSLHLIEQTKVTPSRTWLVQSIENQLSADQVETLGRWARGAPGAPPKFDLEGFDSEASRLMGWHLVAAYNHYLFQNQLIDPALWSQHHLYLTENSPRTAYTLDVPDNARPQNAPGDSQFSVGYTVRDGQSFLSASYLPASHTLLDDSAQGLGPSSLTLLQATVFKAQASDQLLIDEFVLYASQTRLPWSRLVGGVSRGVRLAYETQHSQYSETRHVTHLTSSWGLSSRIGIDLLAYAEAEIGAGYNEPDLYLEARPGLGLLINEIWGMKTHIAYHHQLNPLGRGGAVNHLGFTQKWRLSRSTSVEFDWACLQGNNQNFRSTSSTWRWKTIF